MKYTMKYTDTRLSEVLDSCSELARYLLVICTAEYCISIHQITTFCWSISGLKYLGWNVICNCVWLMRILSMCVWNNSVRLRGREELWGFQWGRPRESYYNLCTSANWIYIVYNIWRIHLPDGLFKMFFYFCLSSRLKTRRTQCTCTLRVWWRVLECESSNASKLSGQWTAPASQSTAVGG